MFVDSHCHLHMLDLSLFDDDMDNVLKAATAEGVGHFLCVSTQLCDYPVLKEIAARYPQVDASVGIHPNEPFEDEETVEQLLELAQASHIIAVGETGLDYFRTEDKADQQRQHRRFVQHIEVAKQCQKPLIVHSRAAPDDTIKLLRENQAQFAGGVMHCFCETWEIAEQALDCGFYISISGIVTFKNAQQLQEVAQKVPLDRLLIETDCPYLAPMPYRGKPNEPAYVRYVAEKIAQLRQISVADVEQHTTDNFFKLFATAEPVNA